MADIPNNLQTNAPEAAADANALQKLQMEIRLHERHDSSQSLLSRGLGWVWAEFHGDDPSQDSLKALYKDAQKTLASGDAAARSQMIDRINTAVKADEKALGGRDTFRQYAGGFAKTAALFATGRIATAATVGIYALDSINPSDSWKGMALDGALGAGKGLGTRAVFAGVGKLNMGIVGKGMAMGFGATLVDAATTRQTYTQAGSIWGGLQDSLASAADRKNLLINAGMFVAAQGLLKGGTMATSGALERSPLLSTMATGGAFGMTTGGVNEIMHQIQTRKYDPWQVAQHMFIQGGLDAAAASIGGVQADAAFRLGAKDYFSNSYASLTDQLQGLKAGALNLADSISLAPRMTPAFAYDATAGGYSGGRFFEVEMPAWRPAAEVQKGPQVLMMQGDGPAITGSGADLEHVLGADGKADLVSTAGMAAQELMARVQQEMRKNEIPPLASEIPSRPEATTAERPAAQPESAAGRPLDPAVTGSEAFQRFQTLAGRVVGTGSGQAERADLVAYLRGHPELKDTVLSYSRSLNNEGLVYAAQEAYKVDSPTVWVDSAEHARAWQELSNIYFPMLDVPSVAARGRKAIADHLNLNPDLRPAALEYAQGSSRMRVVEALDWYFGTRNADALRLIQSQQAAWAKADTTSSTGAQNRPAGDPQRPIKATLDPTAPPGASSLIGEAVPPGAPSESATTPAVRPEIVDAPGYTPPSADNPRGTISNDEFAKGLTSGSAATRAATARILASQGDLSRLSPENFRLWLSEARNMLPEVFMLMRRPGLAAVPPEVVQRFLGKPQASGDAPEWAADAVRTSQEMQAKRDQMSLERLQRDLERARDDQEKARIQSRIKRQKQNGQRNTDMANRYAEFPNRAKLLGTALDAIDRAPELAGAPGQKLIELGAQHPLALDKILYSIGYRSREGTYDPADELGAKNRQLLLQVLPNAASIEPVRYLIQFLRDGNSDGVFQAAKQLLPPVDGDAWLAQLLSDLDAGVYRPARTFGNNSRGPNQPRERQQTQGPARQPEAASGDRSTATLPAVVPPAVKVVDGEPVQRVTTLNPAEEVATVNPAAQATGGNQPVTTLNPAEEVAPVNPADQVTASNQPDTTVQPPEPPTPVAQLTAPHPVGTGDAVTPPENARVASPPQTSSDPLADVTPFKHKVTEQQRESLENWFKSLKPSVQRNMFRNNTEIRGQSVKGMYTRQLCKLLGYIPEGAQTGN